ncbi:MAG: hypothetical protein NTY30_02585 [Candidatus Berkelbacteria bacterium]|nr:hypothetical protein [Candidatus Berkelbacteria bacterium]
MMPSSKTNKKNAYKILVALGGLATTRRIATILDRNVNGVSQTLGSIEGLRMGGGRGGDTEWIIPTGHRFDG